MCTTGCLPMCVAHPMQVAATLRVVHSNGHYAHPDHRHHELGHMKYHASPLVMLGIGVWALYLCIVLPFTYAKCRYIVTVFGSPGLLPSCLGPCVAAPLLPWRTSRCWRLVPLCMSASCRLGPLCLTVCPWPSLFV